jgi:hypothetical protein
MRRIASQVECQEVLLGLAWALAMVVHDRPYHLPIAPGIDAIDCDSERSGLVLWAGDEAWQCDLTTVSVSTSGQRSQHQLTTHIMPLYIVHYGGHMPCPHRFSPSSSISLVDEPIYLPGIPPDCIAWAFISENRLPTRSDAFMCLSKQRRTQDSSREARDLVEKSLMQSSKHCWTRLEYICHRVSHRQCHLFRASLGCNVRS